MERSSEVKHAAQQFAELLARRRQNGNGGALAIAYVTETYPPEINGVAHTAQRAVEHLVERGHAVQLVRPRQPGSPLRGSPDRYCELLTGGMRLPMYPDLRMGLVSAGTLMRLWDRVRPDVVHVATEGPLGAAALRAARKLVIPVTSDFRTNFHLYSEHYRLGLLRPAALSYLRWFHNRAALTMVPTRQIAEDLARHGFVNVEVVGRGVDAQLFNPERRSVALRREWGAGEADTVVLYVGRLAPEKNVALALRAFEAYRRHDVSARLVMVGDGPLRLQIERLHPQPVLTGWRRGVELAQCYASADLFLFPSMTETFGNVTLEALASGLTVVAFDHAAAAQHMQDGCNGFLVAAGDAQGYVRIVERLASDREHAHSVRAAARDTGASLAWSRVLDLFEGALLAAVARRKAARYAADLARAA